MDHAHEVALKPSSACAGRIYGRKVLEFLLLERLELVFLEAGLPHINQSAYKRAVPCEDAVFATQEIVAKYLREGSRVYMCSYDLFF